MHLENSRSISSAQTCTHDALICWNTTAVIGWPAGHKSSRWQSGALGKRTIWSNKENVSENGKLGFLSASRSQWKQLTALKTNETLFEAFLFEVSLAVSLFLPSLYLHFHLREKLELCVVMDSEMKGNLWFPTSPRPSQVEISRKPIWVCSRSAGIVSLSEFFAIRRFERPSRELCKLCNSFVLFCFFSFPENWTWLPLMTYSQTDTKAFFLHDFFIEFLHFVLKSVIFQRGSLRFISLGTLSPGL